ncbi:MMS19 nucleotide excision repair protein-like protein [Auxenochlorella protothecoides]|uniref:MMS19 nucleotide excision repair protein n=1 Tax=Auxenochlorella protothecoides TaxID=3075 RepID=A0A087SU90_AUXPR|nr:MMS19 nucleotide excision repair protein-like protein [Auxenochlorella protothecoides]KFM29294.1 MMS19 nucleotide excision repair protein-like protein [Auxenochlorella protothecoides]
MFLENPACPPSLSQAQLLSVAKNLTSNVFVQHLPQTERLLAYRALQALVQDYGQQLLDAGVSLWDACLAGMDGERDPRGLLAAFALARSLMALYSAQPSNSLAAGQMEEGSEELFDILSCYFPISFSPPANDPHGITREGLARALADVLLCSPAFLPYLLPVLLEKLASSLRQAKTDALDLLRRVPGACSPADLDAHADWGEVWTRLRAEICLPEALEAPALGSAQDLATPAAQCLAEWVSQLSRVRHGLGSSLVQDAAVQQALQCLRDPGSTQAAQARASRLVQAGVHILSGVCSSVAACDELEDALGRITEAIKSPTAPLAAQALAWQGLAQMIKAGPRILTALLAPCQEWVQLAIRRHDVAEAQQASEVIAVSDADLWTLDWPCTASTVTLRSLCFLQRAVEVLGPSGLGPAAQEAALYLTLQAMDAAEPDLAASAMQTLLALARFGEESRALLAIVLRAALQGEGPGAWAPAGDALVRQLARASATACTMGIEAALARLRPDAEGAAAMEAIGAEGSIDAGHVLAALNCLADLLTHPHDESGSEGVLAALLGAYKSGTDGEAEAAAQLVAAALPGASPAAQAAWAGRAKASLLATESDPGVALVHCGVLIGCSRAAARAACSLTLVRRLSELWRTDGQRSLYIEAAASLVNKWPDDRPEGLVPALDEGIAACCRPAAGVEDGPRFVRGVLAAAAQRSPSALVRPLWRQRTLTLLVSALLRALGPPPPFVPALCTLGAALTSVDPALQRSQLARVETLLAPCLAAVADLPGPEQTVTGLLDMLAGLAGSGATTGEGGMGWIGSFSL